MNASLVYRKDELVFDIKSRAFAMARSAAERGETPEKDDHWLMDVALKDDGTTMNEEVAGRLIEQAFSECQYATDGYSVDYAKDGYVGSDRYKDAGEYVINLEFDGSVKQGVIRLLKSTIHELIVYKVLRGWCELVAPERYELLSARVVELEAQLRSTLSHAVTKERPYFPVW